MPRYNDLTDIQSSALKDSLEFAKKHGKRSVLVSVVETGTDSPTVIANPDQPSEHLQRRLERNDIVAWESKEYVTSSWISQDLVALTFTPRAYELAEYLGRSERSRRWDDFRWEMNHDSSARAKAIWAITASVLSVLATIAGAAALRALGF